MLQDFETVSAVSHRHWGHLSVATCLTLHLTHHVESRAWPGFETCFKEQEGEKQIKLVFRTVILESQGFFQCIFPGLAEKEGLVSRYRPGNRATCSAVWHCCQFHTSACINPQLVYVLVSLK